MNMIRFVELPACEIRNLKLISRTIKSCLESLASRKYLLSVVKQHQIIEKLLILFPVCEALHNYDSLYDLNDIFRHFLLLQNEDILDLLFHSDNIHTLIGILEYERGNTPPSRSKYREQLIETRFHNPMKIRNVPLLKKIHQIHRVQFVQEILMPASLLFVEVPHKPLDGFLRKNKGQIVEFIRRDKNFLRKISHLIKSPKTPKAKKLQVLGFIKELLQFATYADFGFYDFLLEIRLFPIIRHCLVSHDLQIVNQAAQLLSFLGHCAKEGLKFYLMEHHTFALTLFSPKLAALSDRCIADEILNVIKIILFNDETALHDKFLAYFYKKFGLEVFTGPLFRLNMPLHIMGLRKAQALEQIIKIFIFCIEHHEDYIRQLSGNVFIAPLECMKSPYKFLVEASLRLLKSLIFLRDDFYNQFLIDFGLMDSVFDILINNKGKENAIQATVLDIFEYMVLLKTKILCVFFMDMVDRLMDKCEYRILRLLLPYYGQLKNVEQWNDD